ncbi:hypothetical protein FSS13T_01550 [Flavobacterium saliperosum S13]|uniref:Por secretion system C-terminal sorting domain-containing protein n=2 Tax=Flavobacterium saliperosum TaxID=329186 RepID=A0A1G4V330_9FLAO|nr:PKD-like domain-containing protein [Flavobacterium saliperosum]ESU27680.1 hypothetical protein FSS13T_01550 [Flavobacterium saliperosum S13]SCX00435.1 Por secretion system C-terminal sorting domain-containing protein [Flavobacterium saliperosum]
MKKSYLLGILLLLYSLFGFSQDCVTQATLSNDVALCFGESTTITLANSDPLITYQLRDGATDIGAPVSGNGGNLVFNVTPGSTTTYSVYAVTCAFTYNDTVTVTVNPIPNAVASTGSQASCSGNPITAITFSGSVAGAVYNWTRNNTVNVTGIAASGSGTISGTLTNTTALPVLVTFTITPTANGCDGTPITATVTVNPTPIVNATNPTQIRCSGAAMATMVLSGTTPGSTFNWSRDNTVDVTGIANSGSGNISGTLVNTTNSPVIVTFTITPTANGCDGSPIFTTVTVNPTPDVTATNSSQTICSGESIATMTLSGNVVGTVFNWTRNNTVNVTGISASGSGNISGVLTNTTASPVLVTFTLTPTANGCNGTPVTATVLVNPIPIVNATNPTQIRCSGAAMATMVLSGTTPGSTFNWSRDNTVDVTGIANSGSGNISGALVNTTNSPVTVTFTITPTANGCDGNPIYTSVTVNPTPDVTVTNSSQTICSGESIATIAFSGNVAGTVFNWTRNNLANVNGIPLSGSGDISGTLTNTNAVPRTITFTITPTANGCNGTPITATVIINPIPIASSSLPNQTRCSGVAIGSFGITSNVTGTTYQWIRDNIVDVTGIGSSGTGTITGTLTNNTNDPQTVNFTVTPTANNCQGSPITVSVLVNPTPNVVATPASQTICSGGTITDIILSGNVTGTTYTWTRTETIDITGIPASGSGDISGILTNNTNSIQTTVFTIRPNANGCNGPTITASITVNPTPTVATVNTSQTVCSGSPITAISFTGTVLGTTYNWTRNNTTTITGLENGAGNITGILTNTTTTQQTATFTITPIANGCPGTPITATVIVEPLSLGGSVTVSQPNITPTVNTATSCHVANGTLYLSGHRGAVVRWEYSTTGGISWLAIANTTNTHTYSNITQSTIFRAVVQNSPCAIAFSTSTMINVIPNIRPTPVTAIPSTICNGDSAVLSSQSGYATSSTLATGGTFSNSNPTGWLVNGCGNCLNAGASNTNPGHWQLSATNGGTYSGINYTSSGKFAIANGDFNSYLYTPIFNTFGLTTATLSFTHAYNFLAGSSGYIQISVNGGAYATIATFAGPSTLGPYNGFAPGSVDLSPYLGQPNLRIRFFYDGVVGSSWAVDNIQIPDAPLNLSTQWVDAVTGVVISNSATMTVTPTETTTYAVTSFLNGCNSFGTDGTAYVTVTVNPRPTARISQDQVVCMGETATFNVALTGRGPWRITYTNGVTSTTVSNILTNPYTFSVPNMTTSRTYTLTALNDVRCTAIGSDISGSATVTVLNGTQGLWTGLVSNDWFDCKNWAGGLPSATIDAQIPTGLTTMPIIDPSSPFAAAYSYIATARDVIISPGASITMTANSNLHVKRDWRNSGNFIPGTGTVTFNGATNNQIQLINSGIKLNEGFYNLTLNGTNGARGVSVADGFELTVANNLLLTSGDLRLTGEAQLVQNGAGPNPPGGTGKLLRDQQGTKSSFHYNYWSSPVSADNLSYTIGSVLKDGTNAVASPFNPGVISFGDGYNYSDGALTSPIKISNRWLYKYTQISTSYWSWQAIGNTGSVKVGEGFTMKGVTGLEPSTNYQNYVFTGKPNNGDINLTMAMNQLYLIGNPYPSALDANAFITDNVLDDGSPMSNVFNGALYFWDHFGGNTHYLNQYIGGYATYNLMGGVVAISNDPLINNNNTTGTKVPQRYIPVAQGFFIRTDIAGATGLSNPITGGTVKFRNSQRAFKTESPAESVFFKSANSTVSQDSDNRQKIRLGFEAASGLRRQLLVGVDTNTSNQFDIGYDAPMIDVNQDDMYWSISNGKFVIQGVPNFNIAQIIPLGVKVTTAGTSKIKIDALENIPASTDIYLFDNTTGMYHDLKNQDFLADLPIGEYNDRFSLRFTTETLSNDEIILNNGIMVFTDSNHILNIKNSISDVRVESVALYNILGQSVAKWDVSNEEQQNIKIPVEHIRSGTYIVKIKTTDGALSKKVIIR